MRRLPPRSTQTDTLFPYPTLYRAARQAEWQRCQLAIVGVRPPRHLEYRRAAQSRRREIDIVTDIEAIEAVKQQAGFACRSEVHTSELQSLMRISYAVFCLTKQISNLLHYLTAQCNPTIA